MKVALEIRLNKNRDQFEFYRQLRVFNPNNLPNMSLSGYDYPALKLDQLHNEIAEHTRSAKRDIDGPDALVQWWQSQAPSLFREHVLVLISSPVASSSVERFFSLRGQLDSDQWALSEYCRRLQFTLLI